MDITEGAAAEMQRLTVEAEAAIMTRSQTMDTLMAMNAKDAEIMQLREKVERLEKELQASASSSAAAPPPPAPPLAAAGSSEDVRAANERAEKAEAELAQVKKAMTTVQAKLEAVSSLYTNAAQENAVLKVQLEAAAAPSSYQ